MPSLRRKLYWLTLSILLWLLVVAYSIWEFGKTDHAQPADCIIVLGAAVQGSKPSPVFAERLRHAANLYQRGVAAKVVLTGGKGADSLYAESGVGREFIRQLGVPKTAILIEENSHTTQQNLTEAASLMHQHALHSTIIVSDPLHLKRASTMAEGMGMAAVTSPTPTTRYRSWQTQMPFLLREVYFLHHYWLFGA